MRLGLFGLRRAKGDGNGPSLDVVEDAPSVEYPWVPRESINLLRLGVLFSAKVLAIFRGLGDGGCLMLCLASPGGSLSSEEDSEFCTGRDL